MVTGLDLLILAVATWRISYMVANERGPYDVLSKLRTRYPLGGLLSCSHCLSLWIAGLMFVVWYTPAAPLVTVCAVAGGALMLGSWSGAEYGE